MHLSKCQASSTPFKRLGKSVVEMCILSKMFHCIFEKRRFRLKMLNKGKNPRLYSHQYYFTNVSFALTDGMRFCNLEIKWPDAARCTYGQDLLS